MNSLVDGECQWALLGTRRERHRYLAACQKVAFAIEAEAMRRLVEIALLGEFRHGTKPVASYFCEACKAWHLTRRAR